MDADIDGAVTTEQCSNPAVVTVVNPQLGIMGDNVQAGIGAFLRFASGDAEETIKA